MIRKFSSLLAILFCSVFLLSNAYAEGTRIAFVNVAKALEDSPQAQAANKRLEIEFAPRNRALLLQRKQLRAYEDKLAKNGMQMTEAQLEVLKRSVRDAKREIRRAQEDYREDLNIRRNEELRKLQKRVKQAIVTVSKQNNYDIVVGEGVLYSSSRVDITKDILKVLTAEFKNAQVAQPPKPVEKKK